MNDYLKYRQYVHVTVKPNTYNSCVTHAAKFDVEIDLMDIESKGATSNTRCGLVAIDDFTKIAEVVPIINKSPEETIMGLNNIFTSMGKPNQL